jgi:Zn-dependent peptidase ImmA (M78 family)
MPRTHFARILPRRFDLGAYARLKQEWGVSIAALLYRARTLGVIGDAAYRRAVMIMNKQYGRRSEPYPLGRPELPALLATACQVAQQAGISREQIASEACLPLEDLDAIVGDPDPRPLVTV